MPTKKHPSNKPRKMRPSRKRGELDESAVRNLADKGATSEEIAAAIGTRWQVVDAILYGTPDRGGAPRKLCDPVAIERLGAIGCTTEEIAAVCGVCKDVIEEQYSEAMQIGKSRARAELRREQWRQAMAGNGTMLVWLGKQMLGQRDKQELTGKDGGPVVIAATEHDETL